VDWFRSFKPYQTYEKVKTLSLFLALWLVVCPVLLGFIHCSLFGGIHNESSLAYSFTINWGTGTLLLNSWAMMCYHKMFSMKFWADLVFRDGQANANVNENRDAGPGGNRQGGVDNPVRNAHVQRDNEQKNANIPREINWQGPDGAIARAIETMKSFAMGWEWDKVDHQILLQDFAIPVVKHLTICSVLPTMAVAAFTPLLRAASRQVNPRTIFRAVAMTSIFVDSINSSKHSLQRWYQAAHKIARDDRYLIGVRLQDYSPTSSS
jgi:hypothetical protein